MKVRSFNTKTVAIASSGTYSASFKVPMGMMFLMALFPDMDAGAIGLEISFDNTTFYPVLDPTDGADAVLCANGSDPGWVDFSDWVRAVLPTLYLRFTCAAQDSGAVDVEIVMKG